MVEDKKPPEFWQVKCYCENEDEYKKIDVPFGTSSEDFFKEPPKCPHCGCNNLVAVVRNHPANPPENTPNVKETDFKK